MLHLKTCNKCHQKKSTNEFYKRGDKKNDGYQYKCITCTKKYKQDNLEYYRGVHRAYRYNITTAGYTELLNKQLGVCAICKKAETVSYKGRLRPLAVDHNHLTGKVRGLLCAQCNSGIGYLQESEQVLISAIQYLREHNGL